MPKHELPHLRGTINEQQVFQNPRGFIPPPFLVPHREPREHGQALLDQVDELARQLAARRSPEDQGPGAGRAIVSVEPAEGHRLKAAELGNATNDTRLLYEDKDTGRVLLDAADPALPHLRKKLTAYIDDEKVTPSGKRSSEEAIAPIARIGRATLEELAGERLRGAGLNEDEPHWFEITCRGGLRAPFETDDSRSRVAKVLERLGQRLFEDQEFIATESVVFYLRLTLAQVKQVIEAAEYVLEVELVEPELLDWATLLVPSTRAVEQFTLTSPPPSAPSVVVLDSGIASKHPLLANAILTADSALPVDSPSLEGSPEDLSSHGTEMAGVALYGDLAEALRVNQAQAPHWIQSVKLLNRPGVGIAAEENRPFWPAIMQIGIQKSELDRVRDRRRVFTMAITADLPHPSQATTWSHAADQLTYNQGRGRLLCVSAGNAPAQDLEHIVGYPRSCLTTTLLDPAQAANVLTIGAYTTKTVLPPDLAGTQQRAHAPVGGISPYTRAGVSGGPIKPDVVFEGGNVAFDGQVPNAGVDTLATLTTHRRFTFNQPLSTMYATSGATAHASRFAAQVWARTPELTPQTVRGLLVHSASWTPAMMQQFPGLDDRLAACGYGVPDLELAIACAADCATTIVEDEMPNRVEVFTPKKVPPKRPTTSTYEEKLVRVAKFFELPLPVDLLLHAHDVSAELRVTLSYFAEPNTFRRKVSRGLDLRWDMQGPQENEAAFKARINKLAREEGPSEWEGSYDWIIGPSRRQRGTVQSDRWVGPAPMLAGSKLLAVYPVGGWWEQRKDLRLEAMPFSLIVTVRASSLPIYQVLVDSLSTSVTVDGV